MRYLGIYVIHDGEANADSVNKDFDCYGPVRACRGEQSCHISQPAITDPHHRGGGHAVAADQITDVAVAQLPLITTTR